MKTLEGRTYRIKEVTFIFPVPLHCGIEAYLNAFLCLDVSGEMVVRDGHVDFQNIILTKMPFIFNDVREYLIGIGVEPNDQSIVDFTLELIRVSSRPVVGVFRDEINFGEYWEMRCKFVP